MKKRAVIALLVLLILSVGTYSRADSSISDSVPRSSLYDIPAYDGEDFVVLQEDRPDFYTWQISPEPYVMFSKLDDLGRTGPAMACLGPETMPTRPRGQIGNVRPSGWHTTRYDDLIEDRYLYNRAHVIGYLLCGDNATPENLFTGTRHLNANSMLSFEKQVVDYMEKTKNHVIYRCSPTYAGDDLVATGVQMEAYSVEDAGGLCFNVFVFNVQPGIVIDYATGESHRAPTRMGPNAEDDTQEAEAPSAPQATEAPVVTYVLNTNTYKFHYPSCPSVQEIKQRNRQDFYGTRDEVIAAGYEPCGRCNP